MSSLKTNIPYAGMPIVMIALLVLYVGKADSFILLSYELLIVFGYIAAISDIKTKTIPNSIVFWMLVAWVIAIAPKLFFDTDTAVRFLVDSTLGFAIGGGLFLLVYIISRKGLGGGDVKYMAGAGLYLGFGKIIPAMLFGTILAAATGLTLIILKKIGRKDKIPLAPFLYIGILIVVFLH